MAKKNQPRPAELLTEEKLKGGWTVKQMSKRDQEMGSGGNNSTGYLVEHDDGRMGFLKAIDYAEAMRGINTPDAMKKVVDHYIFERDLCVLCRERGLSKVVHAITHGSHIVDPDHPMSDFFKVEYLIFELADGGDIRVFLDTEEGSGPAFKIKALHNIATAIRQLHSIGIAHQDLKPSNVMIFRKDSVSKVADLGSAWARDIASPLDGKEIAGDSSYAPFELFSGRPLTVEQRRFGCDLYQLGSLAVFLFAGIHITPIISGFLHPSQHMKRAAYDFDDFLPYLEEAFAEAMYQIEAEIPDYFRPELVTMIGQMCHPDPARRGHPLNRKSDQYSLERYVSLLDLLCKRADLKARMRNS